MPLNLAHVTRLNARDILAALPDAVAMAIGSHSPRSPHPFAELVAEKPLRTAAYAAGCLLAAPRDGEPQAATIGLGLRTPQFASALAESLQAEARRRYDALATHRSFVATVEVARLGEPEPVGAADLNAALDDVTGGAEYHIGRGVLSDGEHLTLYSYGRLLMIDRHTVINDEHDLLADAIAASGGSAARHERRLIAMTLETSGNLADGRPIFNAGNTLATAFSTAALGQAMAILRAQLALDGFALDAPLASLVVAPDLELSANNIVASSLLNGPLFGGPGTAPIVHALAGLPAGRYYPLAAPSAAKTISVARLKGHTHPLAVEAAKLPVQFDGLALRVRLDFGCSMLGRVGIVRGGS